MNPRPHVIGDPTRVYDPKARPPKVQFPLEMTEDLRAHMMTKGWIAVALTNHWEVLRMRELGNFPTDGEDDGSEPTFKSGPNLVIYKRGSGGIGTVDKDHRELVAEYLKVKA